MDYLKWLRQSIRKRRYVLSEHAQEERLDEAISVNEIEEAILLGKILEDYPTDPRGRSCLILGYPQGKPLHVVCGRKGNWAVIITVYIPKPPFWQTPEKRGVEVL